MAKYHNFNMINLFSDFLVEALRIKRELSIPYVRVLPEDVRNPDIGSCRIYRFIEGVQELEGDNRYAVMVRKHDHGGINEFGNVNGEGWGTGTSRRTAAAASNRQTTEMKTIDGRNINTSGLREQVYLPRAVAVEHINPNVEFIWRNTIPFRKYSASSLGYYRSFKTVIEKIEFVEQKKSVLVYVEDNSQITTSRSGLIGNYNLNNNTLPEHMYHYHNWQLRDRSGTSNRIRVGGPNYRYMGSIDDFLTEESENVPNKFIFKEGSVLFCDIREINSDFVSEKKKTYLREILEQMQGGLQMTENKILESYNQIKSEWKIMDTHKESMFVGAAIYIYDNLRSTIFPSGTISFNTVEGDYRFREISNFACLHLGNTVSEEIDVNGDNYWFEHGILPHTHGVRYFRYADYRHTGGNTSMHARLNIPDSPIRTEMQSDRVGIYNENNRCPMNLRTEPRRLFVYKGADNA